jgi:hypothetical protein
LLTFAHPGLVFKGLWTEAAWSLRGRKVEEGKGVGEGWGKRDLATANNEEKMVADQRGREPPKMPYRR